ncbi:hypothetical protein GCM10007103_12200 [Salinimicrobium marinum]|uniref:Uncharacterized protein n=1 Tax=Salinimicrobium marinum TaxID=680283 RepID=A0A918VV46_9FLAO|nr:hypothetical protein GCM10007103_12200 [Salinimicrobium marinum]
MDNQKTKNYVDDHTKYSITSLGRIYEPWFGNYFFNKSCTNYYWMVTRSNSRIHRELEPITEKVHEAKKRALEFRSTLFYYNQNSINKE